MPRLFRPHSSATSTFWTFVRATTAISLLATTACNPFPEVEVPDAEEAESPEPATTAPASADEILARYVTAMGGEATLRQLQQRSVSGSITYKAQAECTPENAEETGCIAEDTSGAFTLFQSADGKMFRQIELTVQGQEQVQQRGFDGQEGWEYQVDPPLLVLDPKDSLAANYEDSILHWYLDYETRGIEPAIEASRPSDTDPNNPNEQAKTLDGLAWGHKEGKLPIKAMWFDRATGLLAEEIEKDPESGVIVRRYFDDYRVVDGVQVAHKIRQISVAKGQAAQEVILAFQDVNHRPIATARYSPPTLPPPPKLPDPWLDALEKSRQAAKQDPKDVLTLVAAARAAFAAAYFDDAEQFASQTIKIDPLDAEAWWISAKVSLMQGELKTALRRLEKAKRAGLRADQLERQLVWLRLQQKDWTGAAKHFRQLAKLLPGNNGATNAESPFSALARRYDNFSGAPIKHRFESKKSCNATLPFVGKGPNGQLDNRPIIQIHVEGEDLAFMFDTGASDLVLKESISKRLIVPTDARAPLALGGPQVPHGQLDQIKLDTLTIENVPTVTFPDEAVSEAAGGTKIDGIIGLRALYPLQITIRPDQKNMILTRDDKSCKKAREQNYSTYSAPFWLHETHHVYLKARLNGQESVLLLNSGMRGVDLAAHKNAYARAGIGTPPIRRGEALTVSVDQLEVAGYRFESLAGAYGYLEQNVSSDGFRFDGMLGVSALDDVAWTLDFDQRKLYLHPITAPNSAAAKSADPTPQSK